MTPQRATNLLDCGDCLARVPELHDESVDLIYLDPPFFSNRNYEVVFGDEAEIRTFEDRWAGGVLHYIEWMRERVTELHRVLKPSGSIYLHCDPSASHYLKLMMDDIFGPKNFRNEIVWKRFSAKNDPKRFGRSHDTLLYYNKSSKFIWNPQYGPFESDYVEQNYRYVEEGTGRRYRLSDLTANKPGGDTDYEWHGMRPYKGRHWAYSREQMDKFLAEGRIVFRRTGMPVYKRYLDESPGVPLQDVWTDIRLHAGSKERLGYPTQKPEALLERIIVASSNEGDVVLDPFCGCGTAIAVAETHGRRWIGIDIAPTAIKICDARMSELGARFLVLNMPETVESLLQLRPFEFQNWVINQIRGKPSARKTADMGVDGYTTEGDPVQVKRTRKIGREVIDTFQTAVVRAKKSRGFLVAGGFTRGAHEEAARAKRETGIEIRLVRIGDLFDDQKMAAHGLFPGRLFAEQPYVPRAVPEARPSAEQLVLSDVEATEGETEEPEGTALETAPVEETPPSHAKAVPDLVEDLLVAAGIERPPVRLEPILEQLNMELSADPKMREDASLVPMTDPELGTPAAWMVFYNPARPEARRRFTLAHEIGHVLLHGTPRGLATAARGGGGKGLSEREVEKFAAELLMPERLVRAAVRQYGANVERLRALFLVSRRAMEIRLRELGLG